MFTWSSMQEIQSAVEAVTGIPVGDDRYVCVDPSTGIVDRVLRCDPECGDLVQGHTLERHDTARIGWRQMLDGSWQRDLEQIQKNIDHEERSKTAQLALVPGGGFPLGPTQADIDSALADTESRLQSLLAELAAREAPR